MRNGLLESSTGTRLYAAMLILIVVFTAAIAVAQEAQPASLAELSASYGARADRQRSSALFQRLAAATSGPQFRLNGDRDLRLIGIDGRGRPYFYAVDNLASAVTISTDQVWPGGGGGFALTGTNAVGELGLWDSGIPLLTHQEFTGRVVSGDGTSIIGAHATQVAGTMMAAGINPAAIGMSYAALLSGFDWTDDNAKMATAAGGGMLISNHSYSVVAGWRQSGDWYWYGDTAISPVEDYGFGFYAPDAQAWDEIAYAAPAYLIVTSAGNDRDDAGPGPGGSHYVWDPDAGPDGDWVLSTDTRDPDGGATGYDTISHTNNAKNILTIGAVEGIAGGYTQPSDVVMTAFSGWGPTDDGRVKPDVVASGTGTFSPNSAADDAYGTYSGTSAASPAVAGSLNLVLEHYRDVHGVAPLASTLKGVAIHTADEAGAAAGPDYEFGWGLLNTLSAVQLVAESATDPLRIREATLAQAQTAIFEGINGGVEPITVTVCWTDPAGSSPTPALDDPSAMLVNDLDVRLERVSDGQLYTPFVLDPSNPSAAATTGDNVRDNVEKIFLAAPTAGDYRVLVSHKGTLTGGAQTFSLITSGLIGDDIPPVAIADLTSAQVLTGNPAGQTTGIVVSWTGAEPGATALLYRKGYGDYPAYDGAVPAVPADPDAALAADWEFAGEFPASGVTDTPATRDFWYHVVFLRDGVGNVSGPSNLTSGALDYHLGDVASPGSATVPDNLVTIPDITQLGTVYGLEFGETGFRYDLDVGPTADGTVTGRPVTDGENGFEDLVVMAINFNDVSKAYTVPEAAPRNTLTLRTGALPPDGQQLEVDLVMEADGTPQAVSAEVAWDRAVLTLVATTAGELLPAQGGHHLLLSPDPGVVDAALLGLRDQGLSGDGVLARLRFRVIADGDPNLTIVGAKARDATNQPVEIAIDSGTPALPAATALLPNAPNPFNPGTTIRFQLVREGPVRISIYSLDGRLVRRLIDEPLIAGQHELYWDGRDDAQRPTASGILLLRMEADGQVLSRRMTLLK
jgi:hypothetical protein